jgi:hypothetical protein
MAFFLIQLPAGNAAPREADAMIVSAASSDDAKAIAKSRFDGDANALWGAATVTQLADVAANAPGLANWRLRIRILDSDPVVSIEVIGTGTNDTVDEIAALAVTALNATSIIANAAYNATTQTLTIAGVDDALGDKTVEVEFLPPATQAGAQPIPGMVGTITDGGAEADPLTVVLPADTYVVPTVLGTFRN